MRFDGRLYTGRLKRATRSLGVHTHLSSLYWRLGVPRLLYTLSSSETITHKVDDVNVTFPTETYWQYQRFRWMHPEVELFEELVADLTDGDVFYDVGAHLGWHSLVAASTDAAVDVVAFEPHPTTASRLETVVETAGYDVDVLDVALYDTAGIVEFSADPHSAAHIDGVLPYELSETITVETARGDRLIADGVVSPPDVLKIDAEGAEIEVLRGLRETIESSPPRTIYCEVHKNEPAVRSLLEAFGYRFEPLASSRPILKAVRR